MRKTTSFLFLLLLFLTACQRGPAAEELAITMVAQTQQAASPTATNTPEPTATLPPTLTAEPTATATPLAPEVLFKENFNGVTSCFNTITLDDGADVGIQRGYYFVEVTQAEQYFRSACDLNFSDFVLEYDLLIKEIQPFSIIGIHYRIREGSTYETLFQDDGSVCSGYFNATTNLFDNEPGCTEVVPGGFEINVRYRIKIVAYKNTIAVFVDDQLVHGAVVIGNDAGYFSMFLLNSQDGITRVQFDNILITEARPEDLPAIGVDF